MTGVFLKLSEILRYLDGDENLSNMIKGEPYYYDELLFCSAIISRTADKIKLFCLMDEEEARQRDAEPSPIELSGTLNISRTGEFSIHEFKCLNCNASKCQHVAAELIFLNRHNINKFERFKPEEVPKAREIIVNNHYNPKTWAEIFNTKQHNSDDEEEEEEGPESDSSELDEAQQKFLQDLIKHIPDSTMAQSLRAKLEAEAKKKTNAKDENQPSTSGSKI